MSEPLQPPFLKLLAGGTAENGFATDDVLAVLLPLMEQVLAAHEKELVAPLNGIDRLEVAEGYLTFAFDKAAPRQKNFSKIDALQAPMSRAVEVVGESRLTLNIDESSLSVSDLAVGAADAPITKPVFLPGYRSWEHAVGHHDELVDIFSLGLLLASLSCGLDFTDSGELEMFAANRSNLFAVNRRLNPVLASVIVQMTELNRHRRAQDLRQIITRLENYREQTADLDFNRIEGFRESGLAGKRRMIQAHLRDRLFEISRRNRLLYFKPTLHTLNLTEASVPLVLDYRNIKLEQLCVWHPALARAIGETTPLSLGKYLRFEDAPYIPGVLDKIISEARRDRAEYGFAQLRLVLCFLRWNNLKEVPEERIHSPLLLLPVELTKKKGVRDNYVLEPTTSEAEVNPALRHHLKELYDLNLPETVDIKETTLEEFYRSLKAQIQGSEPGVSLNLVDRPQIELISAKARQRLDQYRRRLKLQGRQVISAAKPDYSYDRENFRPLGLQLFLSRVRPTPMPLREMLGAAPQGRLPHIVEPAGQGKALETDQQLFALRQGDNQNPYSWDYDLCSLTLGNFNYRKMTLVRDYAKLIETDMASGAFDRVFSLSPRPNDEAPPPLELADQHLIISCDATQASAVARARTGTSYIIQGPPGTGKSQTITNLIADYVAQGKRVLFVCEKRAAIDVVFHRLRQQGLDELCCLIHDSQTDKKAFILNLKQTYEKFVSEADADTEAEKARASALRAIDSDLAGLRRFSEVMQHTDTHTGVAVRSLLHRLVELGNRARDLPPEVEDLLPEYPVWIEYGDLVERLRTVLTDLGEDLCFAKHPIHWLGKGILQADRPIESLLGHLDQAEDLMDGIESSLELSGLSADLWRNLEDLRAILEFSHRARPLAERRLLDLLTGGPKAAPFEARAQELQTKHDALRRAKEKASGWKDPLPPDETQYALTQALAFEKSIFRFLQPSFWRLKNTLHSRYDFARHAVAPPWSRILKELGSQHDAEAKLEAVRTRACAEWQTDNPDVFREEATKLRSDSRTARPSVQAMLQQASQTSPDAGLIHALAAVHERFAELDATLSSLLAKPWDAGFTELAEVLTALRGQTGVLAELSPFLAELADLPDSLSHALRHVELPLGDFEAIIAHKSMNQIYRQDRAINRFEGRTLARRMETLERHYRDWLALNARCIRAGVRRNLTEHVRISSLPASQLDADQKAFKKSYAAGRRDLEHEFGKTMRYKSIRDLAAGDTGQVIQDLKPIWLMSPLSVSDTLPLDPDLFNVVIFDEASQIPLEEAIPAIYRSHQVIVVGDEMQLPPTTFFASSRHEDESVTVEEDGERFEVDLDADSFLTQSATNLPSTLLAWHYRSRYESLISFSNAAYYSGNLFTIPDRQRALAGQQELIVKGSDEADANVDGLLARSISFHFMTNGVYADRCNPNEAAYIAKLVRGLLRRNTELSIGVVAFSEAQQAEIESALSQLSEQDSAFAALLEAEYVREENDVFCGLFVKNLENVQGDERDIIIMSVCYGHDANGRMLMNFGPINQRGGEKRLNVIFSRARNHMALVSSIRHHDITNDYNDGANSLKHFLQYAEAVSRGDAVQARRVLENLNPVSRKALAPPAPGDAVVDQLARALRDRGYKVEISVGQSRFRCDLAVRASNDELHRLGILVDTEAHYANPNLFDRYLMQPSILRAFGWSFALVLTKDWYHNPDDVLARLEKVLEGAESDEESIEDDQPPDPPMPVPEIQKAEAASPPQAVTAGARYFEFIGGSSRKYWEISESELAFTVRFGRIGTPGQSQTRTFADHEQMKREADRLINEKVKKGYEEKSGASS